MSISNPTYNELAQYCHFFAAFSIEATAAHFGYPISGAVLSSAYILIKEFWYDLKYERPEVSGGWTGGLLDAACWVGGGLSAFWIFG